MGDKMSASDDLTGAITQLANEGLACTSGTERDGKKIYIVDSLGLIEDELTFCTPRAHSRETVFRHYLVDRAA